MEKEITIFICENPEVSKEIISKYLFVGEGKITYVNVLPAEKYEEVTKKIEEVEN